MKKIPTIFERDWAGDRSRVIDRPVDEAAWVFADEGVATRKFDGTAVMILGGFVFKRYELKKGRSAPDGFMAADEPDDVTGDVPGWVPMGDGPDDSWLRESISTGLPEPGTYELCGPKVQGNPEHFDSHVLIRHGAETLEDAPRDFQGLRDYLLPRDIEGIVWHHSDGRMAKIKKRDFGLKRRGDG